MILPPFTAPIFWRKPFISPAAEIWDADFELYGADCPLGPGVWVDRIGGLQVSCVGSGDWYLTERGAAGVTKADVCYATFGLDVAVKVSSKMFTEDRTVAILWEREATTSSPPNIPMFWAKWTSNTAGDPYVSFGLHDGVGYRPGNYYSGTISGFGLPRTDGSANRLMLGGVRKPLAMSANNREILIYTTEDWSSPASSGAGLAYPGGFSSGGIFRRYGLGGYGEITDATTRRLAFKAIASAPGLASAAALKAWAIAEGVVWP